MGLFDSSEEAAAYTYKMLFSSPFNYERDRQIKAFLALEAPCRCRVFMLARRTQKVTDPGAISEFTGGGESIVITNDALDGRTSFMTIEVKSNEASAEAINAAFADIKSALLDADIFFRKF